MDLEHGLSFVIDAALRPPPAVVEDEHSLFQLLIAPSERLTKESVAHAPWPEVLPAPEDLHPPRRAVSLEESIPPAPCIRVDMRQAILVRNQLLAADLGAVTDFGQVVKWHPATLATCMALSLYTDGSALQAAGVGAMAVLFIIHTPYGDRFAGFRSRRMSTEATAMMTEKSAVCLALMWIAQIMEIRAEFRGLPCHLCFDNMVAGLLAAGLWKPRTADPLAVLSRSMAQWIVERHQVVLRWHHVDILATR